MKHLKSQMKHSVALVIGLSIILVSSLFNKAGAFPPVKIKITIPISQHGDASCPGGGGICLRGTHVGFGIVTQPQIDNGLGNVDVSVNPLNPNQLHLEIFQDTQSPDGLIHIEQASLGAQLSYRLGFDSIEVLTGNYPIDYSSLQYGEVNIDAVFIGPSSIPTLGEWGLISFGVVLLGVGAFFIWKR